MVDNNDIDEYITNIMNKIDDKNIDNIKNKSCAPKMKYEAGSCARLSVLIEMAKAYNKMSEKNDYIRLSTNMEIINPPKYKKYLIYELNSRIGDKCTTQKCWAKQEFINLMEKNARDEFTKYTHKPDSPQGKYDWLSTYDIDAVMNQYFKESNGFKFFGAVPMDFADLNLEIGNVDYESYYNNGIRKLGVIFNLDNHNQPGSHWVALYTDFDKGYIYYSDSGGVKPEARVRSLMRQQAKFMMSKGKTLKDMTIEYNNKKHQKEDTECGVYSINFLIQMSNGISFDEYRTKTLTDKMINEYRDIYFDKYNKKKK